MGEAKRDLDAMPTLNDSLMELRAIGFCGSKSGRPDYLGTLSSASAVNLWREIERLKKFEARIRAAAEPTP